MAKSTPATLALEKAGIAFALHEYEYDPHAERITGYHVGGISPFGQKKRVPVFIEQSALAFSRIVMNGGRRGLQVELAPADAVRVLGAMAVEIC